MSEDYVVVLPAKARQVDDRPLASRKVPSVKFCH